MIQLQKRVNSATILISFFVLCKRSGEVEECRGRRLYLSLGLQVSSQMVSKRLHEIRIGGVHIVKCRERYFFSFLGQSAQYMILLYI